MLIGLDVDGVLCELGPRLASRIADRFGVATHPATWRTYDLRLLRLGLPERRFEAFLDEVFTDPTLYQGAPAVEGAVAGVAQLREAGWRVVAITARPDILAGVTAAWLAAHGVAVEATYHTLVGSKAQVASRLGVHVTIEDNPDEAELLGQVCESWLLDRPYNRDCTLVRAHRLSSWDDAVGRLCQLRLFA